MRRFSNVLLGALWVGLVVAGCGGSEEEARPSSSNAGQDAGTGSSSGGGGGSNVGSGCKSIGAEIALGAGQGTTPSIAWGGGMYAVAWQAKGAGTDEVRVTLVKPGAGVAGERVLGTLPSGNTAVPRLMADGNGWLVVWQAPSAAGGSVIRAQRLAEDGAPVGATMDVATSSSVEARPAMARLSSGLAFVWMDAQSSARIGLLGGQGMGPISALPAGARYPAIAVADGGEAAIAWSDGATLSFSRALPPAAIQGVTVRSGPGEARLPRIANAGSAGHLIVWEDTRAPQEQVYMARVDAAGNVVGEVRVDDDDSSANWPDVVWTGTEAAVVYYQFQGPPVIYLARLGADLKPKGSPVRVSGKGARFPSIAWNGNELGVAWAIKDGGVRMTRLVCD
jgi:hypothetical protein